MSANLLTASPLWTAAGWTMLHLAWVGVVIGAIAVLLRKLLHAARPETRYGVASLCLVALSISPAVIFLQVVASESRSAAGMMNSTDGGSGSRGSVRGSDHRLTTREALRSVAPLQPPITRARWRLDDLVPFLPWFWLCGSTLTQVMLVTGLVGVERLRRSSRIVESGDLARRTCALADSLGIARRVSVAICDRLAVPVLIGIVRPLILLPPAALGGWSVCQLEMVLLHEFAHVRRWDNLVNLLQRFVESLLFFHPVVWWLSAWVRLERELCCDRFVVEQLGQPVAYAEMLVALSRSRGPGHQPALAMADRQVVTRIRRLLNLEERSMKLTLPEGFGFLCAMVLGTVTMLGSQAAQTKPVDPADNTGRSVPGTAVDDRKDMPALDGIPVTERLARKKSKERKPSVVRVDPVNPREISLFARDERRLQIVQLPTSSEGVMTYKCKGGIEIVCHTRKYGTIRTEADEAVIKRVKPRENEYAGGPRGETWYEEAEVPTEVYLKGNVVIRIGGKGEQQTIRASDADYDFVTDRLRAHDAVLEWDAPGLGTPIKMSSSRIEQFHPDERQPDGSLAPSDRRELKAGHDESPKVITPFYRSTTPRDPKDPKP